MLVSAVLALLVQTHNGEEQYIRKEKTQMTQMYASTGIQAYGAPKKLHSGVNSFLLLPIMEDIWLSLLIVVH